MAAHVTMHQLLYNMRKVGASDLHLKVGLPPTYRVSAELVAPPGLPALTAECTERLLNEIIPAQLLPRFEERGDLDFAAYHLLDEHTPEGEEARPDRFRCNVFRAGGAMHAAIRRVNPTIPSFESLQLPPIYEKLADETHEGLVLVVGVTGSGKSTTLACMLERINAMRRENIVSVEDPVEYLIRPKRSVVSQREIGTDVPDYASALKYIVRQDPDVIFIGELRDHDTVLAAIQASETGHLVFGSLHTADTMQCFSRIIEFFPENEHGFVRSALASALRAVCAQRLLPALKDNVPSGVVPATEVLINNAIVREKIRDAEDADLPTILRSSEDDGMHSFTTSLARLVEQEKVALHTALEYAPNREALSSRLRGLEVQTTKLVNRVR